MSFEQITKIILGSGLFAFLVAELINVIKRVILKRRIKKEIAFELIFDEFAAKFILEILAF